MKKIKAYTLMELIVVMVITMIVVSITYKIFDLVFNQYRSFKNNSERIHQILLLETLLTRDFSESKYVFRIPGGIRCKYSNKNVVYNMSDDYIVREQESLVDTFNIKPDNLSYEFLMMDTKKSVRYISGMSFECDAPSECKKFVYRKLYGAETLISVEE